MTKSFSQERHDYIKGWPNIKKFEVEQEYADKLQKFGEDVFLPFPITHSNDVDHNITVSFVIDALDVMPTFPNLAFDFIFRAFDNYAGKVFGKSIVLEKLELSIQKWADTLDNNADLKVVFDKLLKYTPLTTCQYLFSRLYKDYDGAKDIVDQNQGQLFHLLNRLLKIERKGPKNNRTATVHNQNFKEIVELVYKKYGYNPNDYINSIRKGSRFYYQFFIRNNVQLYDASGTPHLFNLDAVDKLRMLVNGVLYTMRNDRAHGSSFSSFKSSKTSLKTYAHNHYCFLAIYFLLHLLIVSSNSIEKAKLVQVMDRNLDMFKKFYGHVLKE